MANKFVSYIKYKRTLTFWSRHFVVGILKFIFLYENCCKLIHISLNSNSKYPINNIHYSDNGSAPNIPQVVSEQKMAYVTDSYMRHSAAMS